jgi:CRISPR-associated protein Csm4
MPQQPKISRERFNTQFSNKGKLFELLQCYKAYRKNNHWPVTLWQSNQGKISDEALFIDWLAGEPDCLNQERIADEPNDMKVAYQPHVSIDRASGSVLAQGGLFFSKGIWYSPGVELDLYVQTENLGTFETLFRHVEAVGYGADKAVGMGQFSFYRDESFDGTLFAVEGSHRLTLSVCFSEKLSGYDGYWIPMVKHGRTWSGFGESNPFKKPFFAFAEGSVFKRMPDTGFLLRNIHSDSRIVQIGWPLTIPVTLEDNHAD